MFTRWAGNSRNRPRMTTHAIERVESNRRRNSHAHRIDTRNWEILLYVGNRRAKIVFEYATNQVLDRYRTHEVEVFSTIVEAGSGIVTPKIEIEGLDGQSDRTRRDYRT